jgi:predicted Rdx family selenoprotein
MGAFELKYEGHIIFSKKFSGLFPSPSMMGARVATFL